MRNWLSAQRLYSSAMSSCHQPRLTIPFLSCTLHMHGSNRTFFNCGCSLSTALKNCSFFSPHSWNVQAMGEIFPTDRSKGVVLCSRQQMTITQSPVNLPVKQDTVVISHLYRPSLEDIRASAVAHPVPHPTALVTLRGPVPRIHYLSRSPLTISLSLPLAGPNYFPTTSQQSPKCSRSPSLPLSSSSHSLSPLMRMLPSPLPSASMVPRFVATFAVPPTADLVAWA